MQDPVTGPCGAMRHSAGAASASLVSMISFMLSQGWFDTFSPSMMKVGVASTPSAVAFV